MDAVLDEIYFNTKHPAGFGGVNKLVKYSKLPREKVEKYLLSNTTYSLHKPVRKRFPTSATIAKYVDQIHQADIAVFSQFKVYNNGYSLLLFIIDVLSRYLWIRPLKSKRAEEVAKAFVDVWREDKRIPAYIHTDMGHEFLGECKRVFELFNVGHYVTGSPFKASICERVQRTIKEKMYKYFTRMNSYRYIDVLDDFVSSYNKSIHRMLKLKPIQVSMKNEKEAFHNLYGNLENTKKSKFKKGDYVRISRYSDFLQVKGYLQGWSNEVFVIDKLTVKNVPMFKLVDLNGEKIKGSFYTEELQKIEYDPNAYHRIEKIIKTVGKGKNAKHLVKWLGWPDKFNSYIKARDIETLA